MKFFNRKVYYISSYSIGSHHEVINSALLMMCVDLFDSVDLYVPSSFCNFVRGKLNSPDYKLVFHPIWLPRVSGKLGIVLRYIIGQIQNIRILISTPSNSILFFNFNNVFGGTLFYWINKYCRKKIIICCHGELELLLSNREGGILYKCLQRDVRTIFMSNRKVNDNVYYFVLGDVILRNLSSLLSQNLLSQFFSIDHPYFFTSIMKNENSQRRKLLLGTIGAMSQSKGADVLKYLAERLDMDKIHISIIGQSDRRYIEEFTRLGIEINESYLERVEFNSKIQELDYVLYLYPIDSYKLTASGAIFDAIQNEKPIIALRNVYFQYLFSKYGVFGVLVDSKEEMLEVINGVISGNYEMNNIDFKKLKQSMSINSIEQVLYKNLESCL